MAHSGKSITFAMDVFPNEDGIYKLGDTNKKWKIFGDVTGNATNVTGTVAISNGGTGTTTAPTQGGIIYAANTSAFASTGAGTSGQILKSNGASAPEWTDEYKVEIEDWTTNS